MGLVDAVRNLMHSARDAGAGFVIEQAAARWLKPYGRMLNLSIDSKTSQVRLEVLLKGEQEPIVISIDEYALTSVAGEDFILIKKASASREWMDALVQDFAAGKSIPLPAKYSHLIKSVLQ